MIGWQKAEAYPKGGLVKSNIQPFQIICYLIQPVYFRNTARYPNSGLLFLAIHETSRTEGAVILVTRFYNSKAHEMKFDICLLFRIYWAQNVVKH